MAFLEHHIFPKFWKDERIRKITQINKHTPLAQKFHYLTVTPIGPLSFLSPKAPISTLPTTPSTGAKPNSAKITKTDLLSQIHRADPEYNTLL